MPPKLPKGTRFEVASKASQKKYVAVLPDGRRVRFGHRDYQHFRDSVPKRAGGGKWAHKDHGDKRRRKNYRARHAALRCKDGTPCISRRYSPAWFSYYFLW